MVAGESGKVLLRDCWKKLLVLEERLIKEKSPIEIRPVELEDRCLLEAGILIYRYTELGAFDHLCTN